MEYWGMAEVRWHPNAKFEVQIGVDYRKKNHR